MSGDTRPKWKSKRWLIAAVVLGVLVSGAIGYGVWSDLSYGDTESEIAAATNRMGAVMRRLSTGSVTWKEIENLGDDLTFFNQRKLQATVLCSLTSQPTEYPLVSVSRERFSLRDREWDAPDSNALAKAIGIGALSLIASIPVA